MTKVFFAVFTVVISLQSISVYTLHGQANKKILLPGIVSELEKKQISIDFGDTSKKITPILRKAFSCHGAFRLSPQSKSQYLLNIV